MCVSVCARLRLFVSVGYVTSYVVFVRGCPRILNSQNQSLTNLAHARARAKEIMLVFHMFAGPKHSLTAPISPTHVCGRAKNARSWDPEGLRCVHGGVGDGQHRPAAALCASFPHGVHHPLAREGMSPWSTVFVRFSLFFSLLFDSSRFTCCRFARRIGFLPHSLTRKTSLSSSPSTFSVLTFRPCAHQIRTLTHPSPGPPPPPCPPLLFNSSLTQHGTCPVCRLNLNDHAEGIA